MAGIMGTGVATVPAATADTGQAGPAQVAATAQLANAYPKGRVTSRSRLAIRSRPTTRSQRLGSLHPGQIVDIKCWTWGQPVRGVRTWYRLGISTPEWVSGRYIRIIKGRVHHC
ncbi:SH3 domain-containing protein [Actinomadura montaniterrae]|uniref:SH3 domain-containing protein n=1 Tax=Actinomadura montaniterrae TaxID=1803903 RepID=A0A6L3W202_9ACTN|nr:SH3 domain-containing protein [Actinomadura montaniterrae]KAB2384532.1 SH3 domain-containing protein [Actinomadura montaniterrae]